jgi:hypothetical protein
MDKNIAAILREDARTVAVCFDITDSDLLGKLYTYVTHLALAANDLVIVPVGSDDLKVAKVVTVSDDLDIEPNCDIKFRWVVAKIDVESHKANIARNKEIEAMLAHSYRMNARQAYAAQFLTGADPKVLALVKGAQA